MDYSSSPIEQLAHVRQLLHHPTLDRAEIFRRLRTVFLEVGYRRYPYALQFPLLYRAAAKPSEAWFNDEHGRPDVRKLHCPPDGVPDVGRCNEKGESVFYASTENAVPVFEVRAQVGATVVISAWVDRQSQSMDDLFVRPIRATGIAVGVRRLLVLLRDGHPLKKELLKDDLFRSDTPQPIKDVDEYIGELFSEPVSDDKSLYRFTSAIAYALVHDVYEPNTLETFDGFIYPSIESRFSGYNVALKATFARPQLKLRGATMYKVMDYTPESATYSLKPVKGLGNHPVDHSYIWRNIDPKHDDVRMILSPFIAATGINRDAILSFEAP